MQTSKRPRKNKEKITLKTYNVYVFCENSNGEKEKITIRLTGTGIIDVMLQAEDMIENSDLKRVSGFRYDLLQVWPFN